MGPHGPCAAPYKFYLPVEFDAPYGFWDLKQPVTGRGLAGPVWPNTTPVWDFCQFWFYQFPYVSVTVSYGTLAGPRTGPVGYEKHWRFPCRARTVPVWGTHGVLRIIWPNHKCTTMSSRMGPVAWCDHENSTDVNFLRALHSASRARNCTGDKNRTGLVVRCDWGIIQVINSKARVIFID